METPTIPRLSHLLTGSLMAALALTLFVTPLGAQQAAPAPQGVYKITAEGVGSFRAADQARSREEALEDALRNAVEQASGIIIESESRMKNFELVKDEVLSRSKGFIKSYKVLKEGAAGPLYKVLIEALVVKSTFIKNLDKSIEELYRRVGRPRVMVVIRERTLNKEGISLDSADGPMKGVAEKEIRKLLMKQGFTFIDHRAAAGIDLMEVALKGDEIVREKVVQAARTSKAEIIILGNATSQFKGVTNNFNMAQADLSLDVIRVDNGQVMASEVISARGLHVNQSTSAVLSLQKAAREVTPKMMEQVSYQWIKDKNEGGRIEIVVKNVQFGQLLTIRRALGTEVSGVKKVQQRSFKKGVALIEVLTRKSAQDVAESLFEVQFPKFTLEIEDVSANKLVVSVSKK